MSKKETVLGNSTVFQDLEPAVLSHIAEQFTERRYQPGDTLFSHGEAGEEFFVMGKGEVTLFTQMGLGERRIRTFIEGEHFGEMALITKERRTGTVRANTELHCLVLDKEGFNTLLEAEPRFSQRMLQTVTHRLRKSDEAGTRDMIAAHQALTFSLASLADSRDPETGAHLARVRAYSQLLAEFLAAHPHYADEITDSFIENMYLITPLHDIGKVAIPDGVLMKQGKLTPAEFEIMAQHTILGAEAIEHVLEFCDFEMFHMARRIILYHHEQWDGGGYPHGISGEDIPLEARIMTIADNYDALLSERVYKPAFSYEDTAQLLREQSGTRFDPIMLEVMLDHIEAFEAIHIAFLNQEEAMR